MKFKSDNSFLYVQGIQFLNGLYTTTNQDEIEILKKYPDSIQVVEDVSATPKEAETDTTEATATDTTKTTKKK